MKNKADIQNFSLISAVARRIDELLMERNLTQYKLAKLAGIAEPTISAIRRQRNKTVSLNVIYAIADGFEMSLSEFFAAEYFNNVTE